MPRKAYEDNPTPRRLLKISSGRCQYARQSCNGHSSALLSAVHGGHTTIAKLLLEAGADVDEQSVTCGRSLEIAAAQGDLETVRLLLDLGANINQKGVQYTNALQASSAHGHVEVVQHLLDRGAKIYTNTLDQLPSGSGAPASEGNERLRNEQSNVREHANMQTQTRNPPQVVEISEGPTAGPNLELDGAQRRLQSSNYYKNQQIATTSPAPLHSGHEFHESRHQPIRPYVSEESFEAQSQIDNESFDYLALSEGETIGTMRNAFDEHHNEDNLPLKQYHIGSPILPRWDPFSEGPVLTPTPTRYPNRTSALSMDALVQKAAKVSNVRTK
ncbi:MAG: hypothetical protein L6R38_004867 [Xanthoria sp. 2 TBL-2021]|nr:MAG: hypothetical protein L6R38_004867 [Xanthoria sp. 2 TBL-2021]